MLAVHVAGRVVAEVDVLGLAVAEHRGSAVVDEDAHPLDVITRHARRVVQRVRLPPERAVFHGDVEPIGPRLADDGNDLCVDVIGHMFFDSEPDRLTRGSPRPAYWKRQTRWPGKGGVAGRTRDVTPMGDRDQNLS